MNLLDQVLHPSVCRPAERTLRTLLADPDGDSVTSPQSAGTNYVICYTPRSGSTHLTSLLQNTGLAGAPADFFNIYYSQLPLESRQVFERTGAHSIASARKQYGSTTVAGYLDTVARLTRTPNGVFGLKMDLAQASILLRRGLFWNPAWNWKYIYLTRRDLVMQAISLFKARTTGLWSHLSVGRETASFDEQEILHDLSDLASTMGRWEAVFGLLGIDLLRITYEDLEARTGATIRRCLDHLAVPASEGQLRIHSVYRKQRTPEDDESAARIRALARAVVCKNMPFNPAHV